MLLAVRAWWKDRTGYCGSEARLHGHYRSQELYLLKVSSCSKGDLLAIIAYVLALGGLGLQTM